MKNNAIPKWKDKNKFEKTLTIFGVIVAIAIIVIAFLQIFEISKDSIIFELLLGLLMLIQTLEYWKYNKKSALICLTSALIIVICCIIVLVI